MSHAIHKHMQKILIVLASLLLVGCSTFSKYSAVEYNNAVAEKVNATTSNIKEIHELYVSGIPVSITEESEIDTAEMAQAFLLREDRTSEIEKLSKLESKDPEQEAAVEEKLTEYIEAVNEYYATYEEILSYYKDGEYKEDPTQVKPLDEILSHKYNEFTDINNEMSDTLESFVE